MASEKYGGLGVSSFFVLNHALLFKWIWHFISSESSLWSRVIKAIYGDLGSLDTPSSFHRRSTWLDIIREVRSLSSKGIDLISFAKRKVGNGEHTLFWKDHWLANSALENLYPRLYASELDKSIKVADKLRDSSLVDSFRRQPRGGIEENQLRLLNANISGILLPNSNDRWIWSLNYSGDFSVKSVHSFIDDSLLPKEDVPTRWVKYVPIKINIFAWKVCLDRLPSRLNLSLRGIEISLILCPLCSIAVESISHLLFSCHVARQILQKIVRWWDLEYIDIHSYEDWLSWLNNIRLNKRLKDIFEGVSYVMWWVIWRFRNQIFFGPKQPHLGLLFDDIALLSFNWCSSRTGSKINRETWLKNPTSISL
ncbi:RNA-directed DNA polymerase, eukaryota, reverse transcriptase zinc-binding domain protein [Tanacetum coccineum]